MKSLLVALAVWLFAAFCFSISLPLFGKRTMVQREEAGRYLAMAHSIYIQQTADISDFVSKDLAWPSAKVNMYPYSQSWQPFVYWLPFTSYIYFIESKMGSSVFSAVDHGDESFMIAGSCGFLLFIFLLFQLFKILELKSYFPVSLTALLATPFFWFAAVHNQQPLIVGALGLVFGLCLICGLKTEKWFLFLLAGSFWGLLSLMDSGLYLVFILGLYLVFRIHSSWKKSVYFLFGVLIAFAVDIFSEVAIYGVWQLQHWRNLRESFQFLTHRGVFAWSLFSSDGIFRLSPILPATLVFLIFRLFQFRDFKRTNKAEVIFKALGCYMLMQILGHFILPYHHQDIHGQFLLQFQIFTCLALAILLKDFSKQRRWIFLVLGFLIVWNLVASFSVLYAPNLSVIGPAEAVQFLSKVWNVMIDDPAAVWAASLKWIPFFIAGAVVWEIIRRLWNKDFFVLATAFFLVTYLTMALTFSLNSASRSSQDFISMREVGRLERLSYDLSKWSRDLMILDWKDSIRQMSLFTEAVQIDFKNLGIVDFADHYQKEIDRNLSYWRERNATQKK